MTVRTGGTWYVAYRDGGSTHGYDESNPAFKPESGEVPYRAIDWTRVTKLRLESQFAESWFDVHRVPEGCEMHLRSRHFMGVTGDMLWAYMVVTSRAGEPASNESVLNVLYWFPDGTTHECPDFNCRDISSYGSGLLNGRQEQMPQQHGQQRCTVSAALHA